MKDIEFLFYKSWCKKCGLKASYYKSLALYQVLFESRLNGLKAIESNTLSVKEQTELAFEVR